MKTLKTVCVAAVAAGGVALLAGQPALARDRAPTARSLSDVETIRVEGNLCPVRVSRQLNDHGFRTSRSGERPDAVLTLDVMTDGDLWDQDSMEEGGYEATLTGARGEVLFRTSGFEESSNLGYLCEKIGDEIATDLERSAG